MPTMGPPIFDHDPTAPGLRAVRFELRPWDVWAYWDGRHWSSGTWLHADAVQRWRNHTPGARMPREDRATRRVVRWRDVLPDPPAGGG